MENLKKFKVTLERQKIEFSTISVTVEAESAEDARILAKYKKIPSYHWPSAEKKEGSISITAIHELPEALMDPIEPAPAEPALTADDVIF